MTEEESDSRNGKAESPPGIPRWVKVSGLAVVIVVAVLVVVLLVVGGEHGPGRHTGAESATMVAATPVPGGLETG